ncbi:AtpZ/AtpI family protein [Candidatus Nomurabacteria bacterium]|nr:AtpZ/AtpI family protein [Candidatus Nomurabacteria bacterium]
MQEKENSQKWWRPVLFLFTRISVWIAIPLIIAVYLGKYLDNRFNTAPWIMLGIMFISFVVSMIAVARISMKYVKEIAEDAKKSLTNIKKYGYNDKDDYERKEDKYYGRD